jgi:signal transduction histidine kinase
MLCRLPKINLTRKFLVCLLLTSIIPLVLVSTVSYNISKSILHEGVSHFTRAFMVEQERYLDLMLQEVESLTARLRWRPSRRRAFWARFYIESRPEDAKKRLMQMKDDFVASVSHELRTPWYAIPGFIELLRGGAISDQAPRKSSWSEPHATPSA